MWRRRIGVVLLCAGIVVVCGELALPSPATAAVLICKKGKKLTLREKCKRSETQVAASELGVTGPAGQPGVQGQPGQDGQDGAPGTFATTLSSGQTIRGNYNIGGTAAAAGGLANTSISFITTFAASPTTHLVRTGDPAPPECTGSATMPEAAPGHLCVYESADRANTGGVTENQVTQSGATIFITSTGAGIFYSYGAWAVTAP